MILACDCNEVGSIGDTCDEQLGQCVCKPNFSGKHCDKCKDGYYDYPECACKFTTAFLKNKLKMVFIRLSMR